MDNPTMTVEEVAEVFHCHEQTVLRYARDPEKCKALGAFKIGRKWLFNRAAISRFLEQCGAGE